MTSRASQLERTSTRAGSLVARFVVDDRGQDMVEYAMLAAFLGIAGWAAAMSIRDVAGVTYQSWIDPNAGVPKLWEEAAPWTTASGS
jgi:Flp pilus assembly pilin Flp